MIRHNINFIPSGSTMVLLPTVVLALEQGSVDKTLSIQFAWLNLFLVYSLQWIPDKQAYDQVVIEAPVAGLVEEHTELDLIRQENFKLSFQLNDVWVVMEYSSISDQWRFCGAGVTNRLTEAAQYKNEAEAIEYALQHPYTREKATYYYLAAMPANKAIFFI